MIYKTLKIRGDATFEDSIDEQLADGWSIWFMTPVRAGTYYVTFCQDPNTVKSEVKLVDIKEEDLR